MPKKKDDQVVDQAELKAEKKATEVKSETAEVTEKEEKKPKKSAKQAKIGEVDLAELLKAGAHFGHQTHRWNPKMAPYIFTKKNNIHIIDLVKTGEKIKEALAFVQNVSSSGGSILFVGTKKQAQKIIKEEAERSGSNYVSERWLGGMLTNFQTIVTRIKHLDQLEARLAEDNFVTKKEKLDASNEREKLLNSFEGIRTMKKMPDVLYIVDILQESNAVKEAKKLGIPVVAVVDTNVNPEGIDYPIPANDDAVRTIKIITGAVADTICGAQKDAE